MAVIVMAAAAVLGACSDDGGDDAGSDGTRGGDSFAGECAAGSWTSTGMVAPSQAGIGPVEPTGGGEGMAIDLLADGSFQIDFGPMEPATATFTSGEQEGVLSTSFSGVGAGTWGPEGGGQGTAEFANFATAKAIATLTLGDTVPPIFDESLQQINDNRMLEGKQVGVFTIESCDEDELVLSTPFPGGTVTITAARDE